MHNVINNISLNGTFSEIEDYNPSFKKVKIKVHAFEEVANNTYITKNSFNYAKNTIFHVPIVSKYNSQKVDKYGFQGDLEGHNLKLEKDNVGNFKLKYDTYPIGVVSGDANISFEEVEENGETFTYLVVDNVFLWKRYDATQKIEEWINNGYTPKVSMEISEVSGQFNNEGIFEIESFTYSAICALGTQHTPAFSKAEIQEQFSQEEIDKEFNKMVKELKNSLEFSTEEFIKKDDYGTGDKIEIDLSKSAANMDGSWGNVDKTELKNKILKASNYKTLVKKVYLVNESGWEDDNKKLKYPVCEVKNNKLILHRDGCLTAKAFLEQNKNESYYDSAKKKLKKYLKELGEDTNFEDDSSKGGSQDMDLEQLLAKYNLTYDKLTELGIDYTQFAVDDLEEEIKKQFQLTNEQKITELINVLEDMEKYENWIGIEMSRFVYVDSTDSMVFAFDRKDKRRIVGFEYTMDGDYVNINTDSMQKYKIEFVPLEGNEPDNNFTLVPEKVMNDYAKSKEEEIKKSFANEKEQLKNDYEKQIGELKQNYEQVKNEKDQLEKYKYEKEAQERQEKEKELFNKYGEQLTKDELEQFKQNASEFSIEDLEGEILKIIGKKYASQKSGKANFTKKNNSKLPLPDDLNKNDGNSKYDKLFQKYGKD